MTPTGIRLKIVRERLGYAEECIEGLRGLPTASRDEFLEDRRTPLAAEALLRRAIEDAVAAELRQAAQRLTSGQ